MVAVVVALAIGGAVTGYVVADRSPAVSVRHVVAPAVQREHSAREGYRQGFRKGLRNTYARAYDRAYVRAYQRAFADAGLAIPGHVNP